ncbi:hypothetical protein [Longitalea luteola]|uniref:hypothetical protein n=1 Tax=Longitalea luteola TaxID=2812563 RepID=UPI001A9697BF|nr:hypothetical protein [Longitalea luteola]
MKSVLLFVFLIMGLCIQAQDLTGIWRGNFKRTPVGSQGRMMELLGGDERYKFEVQIDQKNKSFKGVTYSYLTTVFYGKATCQGTVNTATKLVRLEELKIVEVRMAGGSDACVMTLNLRYSKEGDEEFLEGSYTSFNTRDSTNCGKGTVFLRKVTTSDFYEEPFLVKRHNEKQKQPEVKVPPRKPDTTAKTGIVKTTPKTPAPAARKPVTTPAKKPENKTVAKAPETKPDVKIVPVDTAKKVNVKLPPLANIPTPKVLASRENELVKTITTNSNEVEVNIYDNGTVDNDTISVYVDKKLVLSKKRLTEKALTLKVNLDDDANYHELVMVAENLGEIPPNTSLMVVKAGKQQYEVRITSTEQKNAVIVFKYQP